MHRYLVNAIVCPGCDADLAVDLQQCPHCGHGTEDRGEPARSVSPTGFQEQAEEAPYPAWIAAGPEDGPVESPIEAHKVNLMDRPAFMLAFLFLASLFLGLPFLWKSRAFRMPAKVLISIMVLIETVVIFWAFGLVMVWCWNRLNGLATGF